MNANPPIVVFAYKRPEELRRCLESLESNYGANNHKLFIIIDGPKSDEDKDLVKECQLVASEIWNFEEVLVSKSSSNAGLSNSIKKGLQEIFVSHERAIIVEDDLVLHTKFLEFMSQGLMVYAKDLSVASIQGFSLIERKDGNAYFLPGADCWGWATWRDRWNSVTWDSKFNLEKIKSSNLEKSFNYENSYNFTKLLELNTKGKIDSWAIDWQASMFLQHRLSLYPPFNLVQNDGEGSGATNTKTFSKELPVVSRKSDWYIPTEVSVIPVIYASVVVAYSRFIQKKRFIRTVLRKIKTINKIQT